MKKIILIRDFLFVFLANKHNEQYALRNYKFLLGLTLLPYYVTIFSVVAIFQYKFGIAPFFKRSNILVNFFNGMVLFSPYFILYKLVERKMSFLPLVKPSEYSVEQYNKGKMKVLEISILGFVSMFVLPPMIEYILHLVLFRQ